MHLICGEALYDVFAQDAGADTAGELRLRAVAGGSPFNVAVGMARLGAEVALASDLARDFLGDRLVTQLYGEGVSELFLRRSATATALAMVATDDQGRPQYSFSGLDSATYCPTGEALAQAETAISGVHLGSIAVVLPNSAMPLQNLARRFADRALVSLDPNIRLSIIPDPAVWHSAIEGLRPFCHVIKASEEDIAALYGGEDADAICRSWLGERTALVALTRGENGASLFSRSVGRVDIPPVRTQVIDTVGAGDSFMAALLAMLVQRGWVSPGIIAALSAEQIGDVGSFAARAASVTCSRRGPMLPTARELSNRDVTLTEAKR